MINIVYWLLVSFILHKLLTAMQHLSVVLFSPAPRHHAFITLISTAALAKTKGVQQNATGQHNNLIGILYLHRHDDWHRLFLHE